MVCKHCGGAMERTHRKEHELCIQEWYDCPGCGWSKFHSVPQNLELRAWLAARAGKNLRIRLNTGLQG